MTKITIQEEHPIHCEERRHVDCWADNVTSNLKNHD